MGFKIKKQIIVEIFSPHLKSTCAPSTCIISFVFFFFLSSFFYEFSHCISAPVIRKELSSFHLLLWVKFYVLNYRQRSGHTVHTKSRIFRGFLNCILGNTGKSGGGERGRVMENTGNEK